MLSSGKSETPPCKSGQLEKDLGLQASSLRHAARLIIFKIMRPSSLVQREQATKLAALHRGKRADRSARSPSVLEHYVTLTCVAFDFATGVVGRCTFSTPSRNSAVTFVLSASSGSVKLRRKVPKDRSMRWNFFF
jgi:hypothetical protein